MYNLSILNIGFYPNYYSHNKVNLILNNIRNIPNISNINETPYTLKYNPEKNIPYFLIELKFEIYDLLTSLNLITVDISNISIKNVLSANTILDVNGYSTAKIILGEQTITFLNVFDSKIKYEIELKKGDLLLIDKNTIQNWKIHYKKSKKNLDNYEINIFY